MVSYEQELESRLAHLSDKEVMEFADAHCPYCRGSGVHTFSVINSHDPADYESELCTCVEEELKKLI